MLDSRSFGNHRPRTKPGILSVFGIGIACGVATTLLLTRNHDEAIKSGGSLGRILSAPPQPYEEHEDVASTEHSGSHVSATSCTDNATNCEEGHGEHSHHRGYLSLFFLLSTITLGCILQVVQERQLPFVPYTCMLFFTGVAIAVGHHFRPQFRIRWARLDNWHDSVDMWEDIDPHLIFYIFLPALIFAEAMKMKIKLFGRLVKQVMVLAGPGVLIGTALTAVFAKYVLPYQWNWTVAFIFGSILAATDPVAVVALFNTLGVSPRLTMLVSGESLINDGTAIVIFTILKPQVFEHLVWDSDGPWGVTLAVLRLTVLAVVVGAVIAVGFLVVIFGTASSRYHSDSMIQVAVTICCAFLSFFIAETELETSGVLAVVSSGLIFAYSAWPRFANRETIHTVWEFIEFVGNTVIFTLAGLLFGDKCMKSFDQNTLDLSDCWWLLVLYIGATAIRFVMVLALFPFLNMLGQRITRKEAVVLVWGGLRGAVGLVLAIIVDLEFNVGNDAENKRTGAKILFHVGGMAMLTVGINAPLTAPLLKWLGLTRPPLLEDEVTTHFEKELDKKKDNRLRELSRDISFRGADHEFVNELVPLLAGSHGDGQDMQARIENTLGARNDSMGRRLIPLGSRLRRQNTVCMATEEDKKERYREIFLRAVQHQYWEDVEGGVVSRTSKVSRILLYSTDHCLDDSDQPLNDWDILQEMLNETFTYPMLSKVWHTLLPHCQMLEHLFPSPSSVCLWKVFASLSYIRAHQAVRDIVPHSLPKDSVLDADVQDAVHKESDAQVKKAFEYLQCLPDDAIEHGKSRMLAGRLLQLQVEDVQKLKSDGFLSDKGAARILHSVQETQRDNEARFFAFDESDDEDSDDEEHGSQEALVSDNAR
mmetsp:Transcript_126359/g.252510  ORF Transcript_126359/g.252510 Transcript_126359/m.252510 type:complete len:876 (-) Transcript_126359:73-2700(-)